MVEVCICACGLSETLHNYCSMYMSKCCFKIGCDVTVQVLWMVFHSILNYCYLHSAYTYGVVSQMLPREEV